MRINRGLLADSWDMLASILYWLGYPKLIVVGSKSKSNKLLNNYLSCALFYLVLYYSCWRRKYQVRKGVVTSHSVMRTLVSHFLTLSLEDHNSGI